jgi:hypothetical protein
MRLPFEATAHIDHYGDRRLAEAVDDYDRRGDCAIFAAARASTFVQCFWLRIFYGWSEEQAR